MAATYTLGGVPTTSVGLRGAGLAGSNPKHRGRQMLAHPSIFWSGLQVEGEDRF